jgi:hypothetical protein
MFGSRRDSEMGRDPEMGKDEVMTQQRGYYSQFGGAFVPEILIAIDTKR